MDQGYFRQRENVQEYGPKAASSQPMDPSEKVSEDMYDQACKKVDRWKVLKPRIVIELKKLGHLLSWTQVLKNRFLESKSIFEKAVCYLDLSSDQIRNLDDDKLRDLLKTIKELSPRMQLLSLLRSGKQQWPKSEIPLKELCQSPSSSGEVPLDDWHDHLYMQLSYIGGLYFTVLHDAHNRIRELVSEDTGKQAQLQSLETVLEKCMNLLVLQKADIARVDQKKEIRRLVKMTKLFVMGALVRNYECGDMKQVWPCENLIAISDLLDQLRRLNEDQVGPALKDGSESSGYKRLPPGYLSEDDWHYEAFKVLRTTRKTHSSKLDEAFNKAYDGILCDRLARTSDKFVKKSLQFLTTSSAEFASLSKEKYEYRILLIKLFVFLTEGCVSANQSSLQSQAAGSLLNWRDWMYEEILELRKMYSFQLDNEAYSTRRVVSIENPVLGKKRKACSNILIEESLDFLGCARADLALMSRVECVDRLDRVTRYLKCSRKFDCEEAYEKSLESLVFQRANKPPWQVEVYEEIKSKRTKFLYEFEAPLKELYEFNFESPELEKEVARLKELERCYDKAVKFFTKRRYEIALLSKEEYNESVVTINEILVKLKDMPTSLRKIRGKNCGYPGDISGILLNQRD